MDKKRLKAFMAKAICGGVVISSIANFLVANLNFDYISRSIHLRLEGDRAPKTEFASIEDARRYVDQEKVKLGLESVPIEVVYTNQLENRRGLALKKQIEDVSAFCQRNPNGKIVLGFGEKYRNQQSADHELYHAYDLTHPEFRTSRLVRTLIPQLAEEYSELKANDYELNKAERQEEIKQRLSKMGVKRVTSK